MRISFKDGGRNRWEGEKEKKVVIYRRDGGRVVGSVKRHKVEHGGERLGLRRRSSTMMAEKFEESDFGPKEIMQPSVEIDEMSRDEYREFKKKVDEQGRAIKLGYDRIKAKVKKLRSGFQKCVAESTRYGCGRIIKEHWDTLVAIWGGAPGAEPLEFRINTMGIPHQSQESQVAKWTPRKVKTCPQKLKMMKKQGHQNVKNKNVQQQDM